MKEIEVEVWLRNNRLKERRMQLGLNQRELSEAAGLSPSVYGQFENMKVSPFHQRTGKWRITVQRLARFHHCLPEDLFPEAVREIEQTRATRTFDAVELPNLLSDHQNQRMLMSPEEVLVTKELTDEVENALRNLTVKEEKVLRLRFGLGGEREHTTGEIGDEFGVGRGRIYQIQCKALHKLRHPGNYGGLHTFMPDSYFDEIRRHREQWKRKAAECVARDKQRRREEIETHRQVIERQREEWKKKAESPEPPSERPSPLSPDAPVKPRAWTVQFQVVVDNEKDVWQTVTAEVYEDGEVEVDMKTLGPLYDEAQRVAAEIKRFVFDHDAV